MDIKTNTILGMNLFGNELKESLVFHIPHSKTDIPEQFKNDFANDDKLIQNEINLLTDFATDEIFTIEDTTKIILLCTSNLVQNLDNAFERRFLFKVKFDSPSVNTKKLIWKNKVPWLADDLVEELSTKFPFSGGQIDNIAKKVAIHKVLNNVNPTREEIIDFCSSETLQLRASKIGYN